MLGKISIGALSVLTFAVLSLSVAGQTPTPLVQCLSDTGVRVSVPGTPEYEAARLVPNLRIDRFPVAIVWPNSTQAVSDVVVCCHENNVTAVPRGGGHSYEVGTLCVASE